MCRLAVTPLMLENTWNSLTARENKTREFGRFGNVFIFFFFRLFIDVPACSSRILGIRSPPVGIRL